MYSVEHLQFPVLETSSFGCEALICLIKLLLRLNSLLHTWHIFDDAVAAVGAAVCVAVGADVGVGVGAVVGVVENAGIFLVAVAIDASTCTDFEGAS